MHRCTHSNSATETCILHACCICQGKYALLSCIAGIVAITATPIALFLHEFKEARECFLCGKALLKGEMQTTFEECGHYFHLRCFLRLEDKVI